MQTTKKQYLLALLISTLFIPAVFAQEKHLELASMFADNMVLQQQTHATIWGKAVPNSEVLITASWAKNAYQTVTEVDGKWRTTLNTPKAGGPFCITVTSGDESIELQNVLSGEVWICSGQSNMQWRMRGFGLDFWKEDVEKANYPNIRYCQVNQVLALETQDSVKSQWTVCSPQTAYSYSAIAFFFGREMHENLNVPIGLIGVNWGGSTAEAWMSEGFLSKEFPEFNEKLGTYPQRVQDNGALYTMLKSDQKRRNGISMQSPAALYNGMLKPLIPFAIRGAIWYQGESNVTNPGQYRTLFPAMIGEWRSEWSQGEFPFYYVQIAPYNYGKAGESAYLREAQTMALSVPETGMAVTMDVGQADNIHPKKKKPVAHRLALLALAKTYGKSDLVFSGPMYRDYKIEGDRIRLGFDHIGSGLSSRDGKELTHFTIAGADRKFVDAQAVIDGETIVVSCENVAHPVAVRFGWGNADKPNLSNKEGLPASSFRTDAWDAGTSSPRIVNIVNFIRQCEPRIDWITEDVLYETVVEQVKSLQSHKLKGTFLLQYDALIDVRYQKLLKGLPAEQFEIGAWWETPQPLVEKSGFKWRGRYPWDWHADVGFATGYSPAERERLVDTYMADFKDIFGHYPKSVASWFIDAHTLLYMYEHYGIVASANCKDQIGTDGYTMWGGYWNQGYYPSKKNAFMPAQNADNQIPVPIFRMLGSDPIHQYDSGLGGNHQRVVSLEPVYTGGGGDPDWCKWYFDAFVDGAAMSYAYVQAGQENSFAWSRMAKGFNIQMPMIAKLQKEGKVTVQTLGETGEWFKRKYPVTPSTAVTVLNDHSEKKQKTVWFNSRFYRANLLWDKGTMRFRDIHLFDETVASDYLTKKGTSTQCNYYTLPFVDGFRWSSLETIAGLRLKSLGGGEMKGGDPVVDDLTEGELTVRWPVDSPEGEIVITFNETSVSVSAEGGIISDWLLELSFDKKAELPFRKIDQGKLFCSYEDAPYAISAEQGVITNEPGSGLRITPEDNRIVLNLSVR